MALKDLMVLLDPSERSSRRLALAAALARRHGAHLTGLCLAEAVRPIDPVALTADGYAYGGSLKAFLDQLAAERTRAIAPVEAAFREQLVRDGIEGEWILGEGPPGPASLARARLADLLIAGQDPPGRDESAYAAPLEDLLLDSGRPLLLIPYYGSFPTCGESILIGWTETREAARAVHDAMPLLISAGSVTVLAIDAPHDETGPREVPTADIARHLARHGVKAVAAETVSGPISTADALLNYASDIGADLIVIGGYGHSRVREIVFGGVTRSLLRHMTVPILFSH